MTVKRFNYKKFIVFIIIVIGIISGIVYGISKLVSNYKYKQTYEYKLLSLGYDSEEVEILLHKFNDDKLEELLKRKVDSNIVSFASEKYFIYENLDKYLDYKKSKKESDNTRIVAIINTEANIDWIDNERETDTSKEELMLVNRLYGLDSKYAPEDIVTVQTQYAYSGIKVRNIILDSIISLIDDAKEEGYTFVVSYGYRTYKEQKNTYNRYANSYGQASADERVARPGHSEYETGLSFDLEPYKYVNNKNKDKNSEEYSWLRENAHRYGFIFRFESDKEYLTGFSEDPWRLRYVGVDAAEMIYNEKICFEEYYAYFVNRGE